ncbi:MAG: UDP-glucose 6-dehydrogenase [Candidatus Marinimicrobia bacterium]|nr:UDP-glucose 6-dehydrogenase [Candidatus Neomarinimicrobiota bacterium]|tara:strand:- start:1123 stop:2523 length:1401 start_codon:yes stop_codon:yes gene_type:complete
MKLVVKTICCIGAGYVGGPTMAVIADNCPDIQVHVVDINEKRIKDWNDSNLSNLPIYEPGLENIIERCRGENLHFSTDVERAISDADMIFLSVNTPTKTKGIGAGQASDLKWIEKSARQVAKYARGNSIVVEKSTLPVKTAETIQKILNTENDKKDNQQSNFYVLSNPEFLAEGSAINDLIYPDRVLIGGDNDDAISALESIYLNWVAKEKIIKTNLWSSELSKLAANAFLAQRISSINSISALCEATGADIGEVSKAIGMDNRIGSKFLKPGPGFGGSCFKKDILNLVYIANYYGLNELAKYWQQVLDLNKWQNRRISKIIIKNLFGTLYEKKIAILGFAFKAETNDTRESPAINICKDLLEEGAHLSIYDPKVSSFQISTDLGCSHNYKSKEGSWISCDSIEDAAYNSDAIIIITEWEEFRTLDWEKLSQVMRFPAWLFDLRRITNVEKAREFGINVWNLGATG